MQTQKMEFNVVNVNDNTTDKDIRPKEKGWYVLCYLVAGKRTWIDVAYWTGRSFKEKPKPWVARSAISFPDENMAWDWCFDQDEFEMAA